MTTEMLTKMFNELPPEMQQQATLTNKAFMKMSQLEQQQEDLNEQLEIARLEWKREDRVWKRMLLDYPPQPEEEKP
jgi:hypothetical protein